MHEIGEIPLLVAASMEVFCTDLFQILIRGKSWQSVFHEAQIFMLDRKRLFSMDVGSWWLDRSVSGFMRGRLSLVLPSSFRADHVGEPKGEKGLRQSTEDGRDCSPDVGSVEVYRIRLHMTHIVVASRVVACMKDGCMARNKQSD